MAGGHDVVESLRPRLPRWLRALRVVHPFPTLVNALTTGGLALVASHGTASPATVAHLMLAMLCIQACIGTVNDLVDRNLDARTKPGKPLVNGALSARAASMLALASCGAATLFSAGFGTAAWLLAMAGLGCGLAYDVYLKRTPFSGLPFILALPLLPLWIWVSLGRFRPELLAAIPLGFLLGLSLHLANSLTDFESDSRANVRGLSHWLGKPRAVAICWGSFLLVLLLIGVSTAVIPYRLTVLTPGLAIGALALAAAALVYKRRPSEWSLQRGWESLVCGSAAMALTWLAALPAH